MWLQLGLLFLVDMLLLSLLLLLLVIVMIYISNNVVFSVGGVIIAGVVL